MSEETVKTLESIVAEIRKHKVHSRKSGNVHGTTAFAAAERIVIDMLIKTLGSVEAV